MMRQTLFRTSTYVAYVTRQCVLFVFFFNDTATTEIYTLSLHDALPIFPRNTNMRVVDSALVLTDRPGTRAERSEEHTSELQSRQYLVCRLLLEKKKKIQQIRNPQLTENHSTPF